VDRSDLDREDLMRTLVLLVALVACSDDGSPPPVDGPPTGDAAPGDMMGTSLATTCTGACRTTSLAATFGATRVLDVAYFGVSASGALYVEAYRGAAAGCPSMNSPTPDYTLILGSVPVPTSTAAITSPANLIDFQGDLLPSVAPVAATAVTLTPVAKNASELALDVDLTFAAGTVSGHLFATHCDSLDD
jgi:hypothetical protein